MLALLRPARGRHLQVDCPCAAARRVIRADVRGAAAQGVRHRRQPLHVDVGRGGDIGEAVSDGPRHLERAVRSTRPARTRRRCASGGTRSPRRIG